MNLLVEFVDLNLFGYPECIFKTDTLAPTGVDQLIGHHTTK